MGTLHTIEGFSDWNNIYSTYFIPHHHIRCSHPRTDNGATPPPLPLAQPIFPYMAGLNLPDIVKLINDPIGHIPTWPTMPPQTLKNFRKSRIRSYQPCDVISLMVLIQWTTQLWTTSTWVSCTITEPSTKIRKHLPEYTWNRGTTHIIWGGK